MRALLNLLAAHHYQQSYCHIVIKKMFAKAVRGAVLKGGILKARKLRFIPNLPL